MASINRYLKASKNILRYPTGFADEKSELSAFARFCEVDLQLSPRTIKCHVWQLKRFLRWLGRREHDDERRMTAGDDGARATERGDEGERTITPDAIREYLTRFKPMSPRTYANVLKALKVYFRDYLRRGDLVETFKFPTYPIEIKQVPTREQLQRFYATLQTPRDRALFLMFATSGLRKHELISTTLKEIDVEKRTILQKGGSRTKRAWVTFFNEEAERALKEYLELRKLGPDRVLFSDRAIKATFKRASEASGIKITPQILREWFACEMGELAVPDRYIDAFCGRVPRSVLARHYTDFSPERLKRIYDGAGLRVLG